MCYEVMFDWFECVGVMVCLMLVGLDFGGLGCDFI